MHADHFTFTKRYNVFLRDLEEDNYPNASTLSKKTNCSISTAKRIITRLQHDHFVPIAYDNSKKGYYLIDKNYKSPEMLPPGKDEFCSLLLARDLLRTFDIGEVDSRIDSLWNKFCSHNKKIRIDLESLISHFSSESTIVSDLADKNVLTFVSLSASGESVRLVYRSPWRHAEDKIYEGRILHVRFSDGHLYLAFLTKDSIAKVFNASFVKEIVALPHSLGIDGFIDYRTKFKNWSEGFGVWAHEELSTIEIKLRAPGSKFFSAERWHDDQEDTWDGDILIRSFPSIISPELVRRVLSVAEFVVCIEPLELRDEVKRHASLMMECLG